MPAGGARALEGALCYLDDGVVSGEGVEVIIEDGLANDVQRQATEEVLHLYGLPRLHCSLQCLRPPAAKPRAQRSEEQAHSLKS